jgi:WD40 repeat protein
VWDVGARKLALTLERHDGLVRSLALSPDDRWLVTAGRDGKLFVWDLVRRQVRAAVDEGAMGFQVVAFSPDGRTLATGGIDRNVTLWDFDQLLRDHAAK